tara:strand:- start:276 stop:1145 length:870 start_codon:yes stop_codon:yes gene_type:complete
MLQNLLRFFLIFILFFSCSSQKNKLENENTITTKEQAVNDSGSDLKDIPLSNEKEFLNQQTNYEIKKLLSEINFLKEQVSKLEIQSSMYTNPFSIYNKEIILNNGSSIFCKILSQDENEIFVETLIGNLTIKKSSMVRIVENVIIIDEEGDKSTDIIEISDEEQTKILSDADLVKNRKNQSSASIILLGDILENKDKSGNTVLVGQLKNIGTKRADLVRIDFILKKNFQGDVVRLTAYANGSSHIFKDTGIISNSSIKPGAIGDFKIIVPNSIGNFIGYSYELYWDFYE